MITSRAELFRPREQLVVDRTAMRIEDQVDQHVAVGGAIGPVPVYNVAVHVTGRDFYVFELGPHEVEVGTIA